MAIRRTFFAFLLCAIVVGSISSASGESAKLLRIGYQKSGVFLLLRNEGSLEKKFAPLGYTIEWRGLSNRSRVLEGLNRWSIDIGHSGDGPVLFAHAPGIPFAYIAASHQRPAIGGGGV